MLWFEAWRGKTTGSFWVCSELTYRRFSIKVEPVGLRLIAQISVKYVSVLKTKKAHTL